MTEYKLTPSFCNVIIALRHHSVDFPPNQLWMSLLVETMPETVQYDGRKPTIKQAWQASMLNGLCHRVLDWANVSSRRSRPSWEQKARSVSVHTKVTNIRSVQILLLKWTWRRSRCSDCEVSSRLSQRSALFFFPENRNAMVENWHYLQSLSFKM